MKILFGRLPGVIIMYVTDILEKMVNSSGKTPLCHACTNLIRTVIYSPFFIQGEVILPAKNIKWTKALNCCVFSCWPFSTFLQHFLLVQMVGAASHSDLFLCIWMQIRTAHTAVRKRKWRASTYKRINGLIWEHLNERMESLGHSKDVVPLSINLVEFDRTKQSQTGPHI